MRVLLVGLVKAPQVKRLRDEALSLGHEVSGCYATDLCLVVSSGDVKATLGASKNLEDYDVFYLWALARHKHEWYAALNALKKRKKIVVVDGRSLDWETRHQPTPAWEYKQLSAAGIAYPRSVVLASPKSIDAILSEFEFPMVVKGSQSRQGKGVELVHSRNELEDAVLRMRKRYPAAVVREFIPNDGDIRVFTIAYQAIGAMLRKAGDGAFLNNISQGALGYPYDLEANPEVRDMAERLSRLMGIEIAGVDVIIHKKTGKPYILEINPGPEFAGIERYTGLNVGKHMLDFFEARLQGVLGKPANALA